MAGIISRICRRTAYLNSSEKSCKYQRNIFDFAKSDCLVSELDILKHDARYLQKIQENDYMTMDNSLYIRVSMVKGLYHRLATIIPLHIKSGMVVPIPCIIDTGAPAYFILGTGAILKCFNKARTSNREDG